MFRFSMSGPLTGMVLCAGLGTRLRPLTERLPKPAAPVCNLPLVQYALALIEGAGSRRAVVNTHHLGDRMAAAARAAAEALGLDVAVSHEPRIAGTGGALREARSLLHGAGEIVIVNGDVLFDVDLGAALAAHRASRALATMVLMPMPPGGVYASVDLDGAGRVRRIARRYGPGGPDLTPWHFTGVHVVSEALLDHVPSEPFECDVNRHVYPPLMERGLVHGHVMEGYWNDLGTPARYLAANLDVLDGRVPLGRFRGADPFAGHEPLGEPGIRVARDARIAPDASLHAPVLVGRGARVERGATVGPRAILGPRSCVSAGGVVRDAVLWEETVVGPGEAVQGAIAAGAARVGSAG